MHPLSAAEMTKEWHGNPRWMGTKRPYSAQQVVKLRGSIQVEHTLVAYVMNKIHVHICKPVMQYKMSRFSNGIIFVPNQYQADT